MRRALKMMTTTTATCNRIAHSAVYQHCQSTNFSRDVHVTPRITYEMTQRDDGRRTQTAAVSAHCETDVKIGYVPWDKTCPPVVRCTCEYLLYLDRRRRSCYLPFKTRQASLRASRFFSQRFQAANIAGFSTAVPVKRWREAGKERQNE